MIVTIVTPGARAAREWLASLRITNGRCSIDIGYRGTQVREYADRGMLTAARKLKRVHTKTCVRVY